MSSSKEDSISSAIKSRGMEGIWSDSGMDSYCALKAGSMDGTGTVPHDKAIVRAMAAKYRPNDRVKGKFERVLFIGRLPALTTEEQLKEASTDDAQAFDRYGSIKRIRLVRDLVTGSFKRYAFVEFRSSEDARRAWRAGHKVQINGNRVIVEHEYERRLKNWVPRRLGGGVGGAKESGQLRFGGRSRPFKERCDLEYREQFK